MHLQHLTPHVYYLPPDDLRDRPMLGYVAGDSWSLAIDGGFSPDQVQGFYKQLEQNGLEHPAMTALTHWHWDHTLGLPAVEGLVVASNLTNDLLRAERERLQDKDYEKRLRSWYVYVDREFPGVPIPIIRLADIVFQDYLRLDLGGVTAELYHVEAPHTPDSTVIYIPEDKVLFLGDATLGSFENGGTMDSKAVRALQKFVDSLDVEWVLLGHEGAERG